VGGGAYDPRRVFLRGFLRRRRSPEPLRPALKALRPGAIAVDCGAHIGRFTRLMADRGADVYAFEPNPHAYALLQERFAGAPNVHCRSEAVSDRGGQARLYLHHRAHEDQVEWAVGSSLISSKGNVREDAYVVVETIDLDEFIATLPRPVTLLKMDVEGAELAILRRLISTGRLASIPYVLVEMHDTRVPELIAEGRVIRQALALPEFSHVRLDWQ
jgi:FkbM family methyltransferase